MTVVIVITVVFILVVGVVVVLMVFVLTVVANATLCAREVGDTLVVAVRVDVLINVVDAVAIVLRFAVSASYSVYVMSGAEVELLMDEFAGVLTGIILGGLSGAGIDALVDVSVNVFAGVATVRFGISAPLERFSCRAAFECRPMAALDCARVLQA